MFLPTFEAMNHASICISQRKEMTSKFDVFLSSFSLIFFQTIVEQARAILETIDGVSSVHGRFYELCSNYHKVSRGITFV